MKLKTFFFILFGIFFWNLSLAQEKIVIPNPLKYGTIPQVLAAIANFIFFIGVAIMPIVIIIGGIMFATSAGEPEKLKKARSLLLWGSIGLVILLLSRLLAYLIASIIGAPTTL